MTTVSDSNLEPDAGQTKGPGAGSPKISDHTLLRPIGSGSYGEVWLAQSVTQAWRAVKVVHRQRFRHDRPFEREFTGILKYEPVSRTHQGVVQILQVGRDEAAPFFYYVMELADDVSWGTEVDPKRFLPRTLGSELEERGRLPFDECLRLAVSLASALGHLHHHGLLHRDVKPSNIIFVRGLPKLADIGLVAEVADAASYVGTEGFVPPEGPGAPSADLYALGKVIYEMATGLDRMSFPELPPDFSRQPDHPGLLELNEVLTKACSHDPSQRYQSAPEMLADLILLQSGKSVQQARSLSARRAAAKRWTLAASAAALVLGGAYLFAELQVRRAHRAEELATERLYDSLLAQSQLGRRSGQVGRQTKTVEAIQAAAAIRPSAELRTEMIAALALADLEDTGWFQTSGIKHLNFAAFTRSFDEYILQDSSGYSRVYRREDDALLATLPPIGPQGNLHWPSESGRYLARLARATGRFTLTEQWRQRPLIDYAPSTRTTAFTKVSFAPNDRYTALLALERNDTCSVYGFELPSGQAIEPLRWQGITATDIAFDSLGERLAVTVENTLRIHSWPACAEIVQRPFQHDLSCLAWHPDGERLALGTTEGDVLLTSLDSPEPLLLRGHSQFIWSVQFDRAGTVLVSTSWDGTTRFWDCIDGTAMFHTQAGLATAFSPDDALLGFCRGEQGLGYWRVRKPVGLARLGAGSPDNPKIEDGDVSPNSRWLVCTDDDSWTLWNLETATRRFSVPVGADIYSVWFTPLSPGVLACTGRGILHWNLSSWTRPELDAVPAATVIDIGDKTPYRVSLASDGSRLAGLIGRTARIVALDSDAPPVELSRPQQESWRSTFLNGSKWFVTSDRKGSMTTVWNGETGQHVRDLGSFYGAVASSLDGRHLVTGASGEIAVWEAGTWLKRVTVPFKDASGADIPVAVSPDNRFVAAAQTRRALHLLRLETGELVTVFESPNLKYIVDICFSPDGRFLVGTTDDHEIQVWNLAVLRERLSQSGLAWD